MAAPITWRTVQSDSQAAAVSNILEQSRQNLVGGLSGLGGILKDQEGMASRNMASLDEASKQAYLDQVASAKTPEELAALQASGALDTARMGLSAAARGAVRGADEARGTALRANVLAQQQFGDTQLDRAEVATNDAIAVAVAQKNFPLAQRLTDESSLRKKGAAQQSIATGARAQVMEGRNDQTYADSLVDRKNLVEVVRPITNEGLIRTNNEQRLATADAAETRGLQNELARMQQIDDAAAKATGQSQKVLASKLGIPMDASGLPDFRSASGTQIASFDALAGSKEWAGIPKSSTSDTARGNARYQELSESGKYSPRVLQANEAAIRNTASSVRPGLVGNDAVAVADATARNQVAFDRIDANNWYAPNSPDARRSYEELATKIPDIVKGSSNGIDAKEDVEAVQSLIGEIGSVGIRRKDGTFVVPSANDVMRFVRSSEGGWFRDDSRAKNIKEALTEWVNSPEAIKMSQDGIKSQSYRDAQKIQQVSRDLLSPPKK